MRSFPTSYFTEEGGPVEGAARSQETWDAVLGILSTLVHEPGGVALTKYVEAIFKTVAEAGMSITLAEDAFPGQVSRVQIDVYGTSASEVEETLLTYAGRCGAAAEARECAYGRCVIERNLNEEWGDSFSWKGRLVLNPALGSTPEGKRAADAVVARDVDLS